MNTPPEDHDLLRWMDGEMNAAEKAAFEARLEATPELKAEAALMQRLSHDLRAHLPAEMPVPYADFFNSQIQVRLAQEENRQTAASGNGGGILSWLRLPWLAPAAMAAALALAALSLWQGQQGGTTGALVHSIYVPDASIQARSYHSSEAQATVLMLDGLEEMPADRKIVGFNLTRGEIDEALAATTLFDTQGHAVAVMSRDARQQPLLVTAATPRR